MMTHQRILPAEALEGCGKGEQVSVPLFIILVTQFTHLSTSIAAVWLADLVTQRMSLQVYLSVDVYSKKGSTSMLCMTTPVHAHSHYSPCKTGATDVAFMGLVLLCRIATSILCAGQVTLGWGKDRGSSVVGGDRSSKRGTKCLCIATQTAVRRVRG
jgi:hypothetical protein